MVQSGRFGGAATEQSGGGIDEVRTSVGYTLPPNVENMDANFFPVYTGGGPLVGNSLDNRITGTAFVALDIFGLTGTTSSMPPAAMALTSMAETATTR